MNIILIGPRGSGKSTIGPLLASALDWPFVELDELALMRTGLASVREVWEIRGEQTWRAAEAEALLGVLTNQKQVIALGGGAPTEPSIEAAIQKRKGTGAIMVVYLNCPVAQLEQRLTEKPGDRPSLTGAGVVNEVTAVLAAREPMYRRLADIVCDTGLGDPAEAVMRLREALRLRRIDTPD